MGDNQAALLKKIEELTLYAIAQEKKLQDQNDMSARQEKAWMEQHKKLEERIAQLVQQNKEIETLKQEMLIFKKMIVNKSDR